MSFPPGFFLLDPAPTPAELPARLPNPFDSASPHPWALAAAGRLQDRLATLPRALVDEIALGKMFGVLVVRDAAGRVGALHAFAGTLGGRWEQEGFAGPVFDLAARNAMWPAAEAELRRYDDALVALTGDDDDRALQAHLATLEQRHAAAEQELVTHHQSRRDLRHAQRMALGSASASDETKSALDRLARESQDDRDARRDLRLAHAAEREAAHAHVRDQAKARAALKQQRTARSNHFLEQILIGYRIANARGQVRSLRDLFAPHTPPGGAGDCAAPKLFAHAQRHGLTPLALAEFWWGAPPAAGDRRHGIFYPSCRGKCGPVLTHMLDGWSVDEFQVPGAAAVAPEQPITLFEDDWIVAVDKPDGLLSVPGRGGALRDSVLARLRERHPTATGPMIVHRLDLDTSGVMLVAKDQATYLALQRQFTLRQIDKRYVARVCGTVPTDEGRIDLALRVDLDDRPRQLHDPVHGRPALTTWKVISRHPDHTRVCLQPHTGRTHQLRVHAAHPAGLNAPIVGDRLYGTADTRLFLHAESLSFTHPHTNDRVRVHSPPPF